jgi:hypothetical protein
MNDETAYPKFTDHLLPLFIISGQSKSVVLIAQEDAFAFLSEYRSIRKVCGSNMHTFEPLNLYPDSNLRGFDPGQHPKLNESKFC